MLALNLVERTPGQLLEPLDWNQGAPTGFLLLAKMSLMCFGTAEWSFRLVPFLGSVVGMIAFAWVARRLLSAEASVMAVALFSISPYLISYAGECKQYVTDAAPAVAMFAASIRLLYGKHGFCRWSVLALAGAIAGGSRIPWPSSSVESAQRCFSMLWSRKTGPHLRVSCDHRVLAREFRLVLLSLPPTSRKQPVSSRLLGRTLSRCRRHHRAI